MPTGDLHPTPTRIRAVTMQQPFVRASAPLCPARPVSSLLSASCCRAAAGATAAADAAAAASGGISLPLSLYLPFLPRRAGWLWPLLPRDHFDHPLPAAASVAMLTTLP